MRPQLLNQEIIIKYIGGDGDKKIDVEETVEKHQLHEQVKLLGSVQHSKVRNVIIS